jgi:hypothetical protein
VGCSSTAVGTAVTGPQFVSNRLAMINGLISRKNLLFI